LEQQTVDPALRAGLRRGDREEDHAEGLTEIRRIAPLSWLLTKSIRPLSLGDRTLTYLGHNARNTQK
jgi:hypothetical protein